MKCIPSLFKSCHPQKNWGTCPPPGDALILPRAVYLYVRTASYVTAGLCSRLGFGTQATSLLDHLQMTCYVATWTEIFSIQRHLATTFMFCLRSSGGPFISFVAIHYEVAIEDFTPVFSFQANLYYVFWIPTIELYWTKYHWYHESAILPYSVTM